MSFHPLAHGAGNGGLQDVDALGWRLDGVVQGRDPAILNAYDRERQFGADENLLNSSRTTRFMSPAPGAERLFRDAVLHLAARAPFARPLVNSGRLSRPCTYPLTGPDDAALPTESRPGAVAPDAPGPQGWLIDQIGGAPVLLAFGQKAPVVAGLKTLRLDPTPEMRTRYLGRAPSALYLIRPDQVVAARWLAATPAQITDALAALWKDRT